MNALAPSPLAATAADLAAPAKATTLLLVDKPEAARRYGLIDDDADERAVRAAVRAIGRLIESGRLRAVRIAGRDLIPPLELEVMIRQEINEAPYRRALKKAIHVAGVRA